MQDKDGTETQPLDEPEASRGRIDQPEVPQTRQAQLEQALRESEDRYRRIIQGVTDYVFTVHVEDGRAIDTVHGSACVAVTGYTAEEFRHDPFLWIRMVHREDVDAVQQAAAQLLSGKSPGPLEHRIWRKDGVVRWVRNTSVPRFDHQRKLISYDGLISDITERKLAQQAAEENERRLQALTERSDAEEALRRSEERFKQVAENALEWIWEVNAEGLYTYSSAVIERILGYRSEELVGQKHFYDLFHPDDREELSRSAFQAFAAKQNFREFKNRRICKDGREVWLSTSATPLLDRAGKLVGYRGVDADITRQKCAEEALERKIVALTQPLGDAGDVTFGDLFNIADVQHLQDDFCAATGVASWITRPDGTPITAQSNFCRLCLDILRKTEKGWANCQRSDAALGQFHPEGPIVRPCLGIGLWGAGASIQVGGSHIANWVIGQVRDTTQTEEHMRAYAREIGADEEEVVEAFREVPQMSRDRFERVAKMLFTLASQLSTAAYQNVQQARFIAERKRAEEALRVSAERLRLALAGADLGTWDWDIPSGIAIFDERWASMLGHALDELEPNVNTWKARLHPDEVSHVMGTLTVHLEGQTENYEIEHRLRHKSGEWIWVLSRGCVIQRDAQGNPLRACGTHLDISPRKMAEKERQNLQAQLAQAQKMESIGRLAGGIAHDFNNLLTAILGYTDIELRRPELLDPDVLNSFREIYKAGERARDLTRQLLAFGRKQTLETRVLDLNEVITNFGRMLNRLIGEDIQIKTILDTSLGKVKADVSQIEQVLLNLAVNARDAMAGGGFLTIETSNVRLDDAYAAAHSEVTPGDYVMLSVADSGCGMDAETLKMAFEPFFTTKGPGQGTGLGLATVYGIIKQHGGHILVYSEPAVGTTFKIYLPRAVQAAKESIAPPEPATPIGGTATILVVEDDVAVRRLTTSVLAGLGYDAIEAEGGTAAILRAGEHEDIQLLVTDVIMPEMSGRDVYEKVRTLHPGIKVLYVSGYTANIIAHRGILDDGVQLLSKPFTVQALAQKIHDVLAGPAPDFSRAAGRVSG